MGQNSKAAVQAVSIHSPLFTLWIWAMPGGRLDQPRKYYRPTLGMRLLPDASQPHITSVGPALAARTVHSRWIACDAVICTLF